MAPNNLPSPKTASTKDKIISQKQKEKSAIMKELESSEKTYNEAAINAEKMLEALRRTFIEERIKELKIADTAKQIEQERVSHEFKLMEIAEDHRTAIKDKKIKSTVLQYRITMFMLLSYVFGSLAFITTLFTDFSTIKELGVAFHRVMLGIF